MEIEHCTGKRKIYCKNEKIFIRLYGMWIRAGSDVLVLYDKISLIAECK
jgi:hypothetical protein